MKSISVKLSLLFLLVSFLSEGQILQPVKWTAEVSKTAASAGDELELIFKATVEENWYMYANDFDPDCGPLLTELAFNDIKNFELVGTMKAINPSAKHDEVFDCDVKVFKKTGEFRQKIRVLGGPLKISVTIQGQVCTEVDGKCIPFDEDFSFDNIIVSGKGKEPKAKTAQEETPNEESKNPVRKTDTSEQVSSTSAPVQNFEENKGPIVDQAVLEGEAEQKHESMWSYMLLAFLLGLTSLITPCVFPMIPMTVTFFLKDNQTKREGVRKAIIFGLSIIIIYTIAGTVFALAFGAEGLNALATHWIPNLFIFAMFIVFALSFLGLFEINAPYKLVNKADQAAEKGGLVGVFFKSVPKCALYLFWTG